MAAASWLNRKPAPSMAKLDDRAAALVCLRRAGEPIGSWRTPVRSWLTPSRKLRHSNSKPLPQPELPCKGSSRREM